MTCVRNRSKNHPLHGEMETSRVDGVKGTPRRAVVLPQPFAPTIIVNGDSNSMACSRSGEKALIPRIASFSIWDMVAQWGSGFAVLISMRSRGPVRRGR